MSTDLQRIMTQVAMPAAIDFGSTHECPFSLFPWRQRSRISRARPPLVYRASAACACQPAAHIDLRAPARCAGRRAAVPLSIPSALMSSSTSGQCTPCPSPISRHFARCAGMASESRHDHASGTLITRPSARWAVIVSSDTSTRAILVSVLTAVLMPSLNDGRLIVDNYPSTLVEFPGSESFFVIGSAFLTCPTCALTRGRSPKAPRSGAAR